MINRAGEKAYQKKFEATEITKYGNMISDEEYNINMCYAKVGQAYLESCEKVPEEYEPFMESIKNSMNKIEEYKNNIRELKGLVVCEKCKEEVSVQSPFCPNCGNKMPERKIALPDTVVCVGCSALINPTMRFCPVCAMPVEHSLNIVLANRQAQQEPTPQIQTGPVCSNCKKPIGHGTKFCIYCGTSVMEEIQNQTSSDVCPGCGTAIRQDTNFCTSCGRKIR